MTDEKLGYCGELVRKYDSDRFLISLVMPPGKRGALWALFAFNHEIAKTREVVTETTLGLIRLQWWRDAIERIYEQGAALQNEILPDLAQAVNECDLPRSWFFTMTYGREFDLENVLPASLEGLEKYAEYTHTPLVLLALKVLGQIEKDEVVTAIAAAYTMTGLMRAVPFYAMQQRCMMPADLMGRYAVSERALYALKPEAGLREVVKAVAERSQALLAAAKPRGKFLRAMAAVAGLYLKQIKGMDYDVFNPRLAQAPAFFHLRFFLKSMF